MDYIGHKCPVCDKYFHAHEDIVVCPECGTPSHRECYNSLGRCVNEDKHAKGYDYQEAVIFGTYEYKANTNNTSDNTDNAENTADTDDEDYSIIACKHCGAKNPGSAFFCSRCGGALHENTNNNNNNTQSTGPAYGQAARNQASNQNSAPYTNGQNVVIFDPLGGIDPETDLGDGVTVSEAAKYVKQNTAYFCRVFNNIKSISRSKFSFCGALFGGAYLLYRKMYKIGALITAIQVAIVIFTTYLSYYLQSSGVLEKIAQAYTKTDINAIFNHIGSLGTYDMIMLFLSVFLEFSLIGIGLIIGFNVNRMYFKHCKKQINKIKNNVSEPSQLEPKLQKSGGVNISIAISLLISYVILTYLPAYFY